MRFALVMVWCLLAGVGEVRAGEAAAPGEGTPVGAGKATAAQRPAKAVLAKGFVYLSDVAPGIRQDMRYAGADNFTGRAVDGYDAGRCILARGVAEALGRVQAALAADGYGLLVFDCYRPTKSVAAFMAWGRGEAGPGIKAYFPRIQRDRVIALGYVARRSSHSLGTAVDLTLVRLEKGEEAGADRAGKDKARGVSCLEAAAFNRHDDEADMGTAFDCFDVNSHTHTKAVDRAQGAARRRLVAAMRGEGFQNYRREWWHFSLPIQGYSTPRNFNVR